MKNPLLFLFSLAFSMSAHAVPGTYVIKCDSAKGAKKSVSIGLSKHEIDTDDFPAGVNLRIDAKSFKATEGDSVASKLMVVRAHTDKVLTVRYKQILHGDQSELTLWAKPNTFRQTEGKPDSIVRKYSFTAQYWLSIGNLNEREAADGLIKCSLSEFEGS